VRRISRVLAYQDLERHVAAGYDNYISALLGEPQGLKCAPEPAPLVALLEALEKIQRWYEGTPCPGGTAVLRFMTKKQRVDLPGFLGPVIPRRRLLLDSVLKFSVRTRPA
jgi:hypothetical protein